MILKNGLQLTKIRLRRRKKLRLCVLMTRETKYNKDVFTDNPWGKQTLQISDSIILQKGSNVLHRYRCINYY